jgi:hypothetical protein
MKAGALVCLVAALAAAVATASTAATPGVCPPMPGPKMVPAGQQRIFGRIVSLRKSGTHYVLGFRPAWLLSGYPAQQIMLAQTGSRDVPNDSIYVDSDRRFTFLVGPSAKVVVLGSGGRPCGIRTTVAGLTAHLKAHRNHFWIRISNRSAVLELDEQYQP